MLSPRFKRFWVSLANPHLQMRDSSWCPLQEEVKWSRGYNLLLVFHHSFEARESNKGRYITLMQYSNWVNYLRYFQRPPQVLSQLVIPRPLRRGFTKCGMPRLPARLNVPLRIWLRFATSISNRPPATPEHLLDLQFMKLRSRPSSAWVTARKTKMRTHPSWRSTGHPCSKKVGEILPLH